MLSLASPNSGYPVTDGKVVYEYKVNNDTQAVAELEMTTNHRR